MEKLVSVSEIGAVTTASVFLALGIEMVLLKVIFRFMSHVKAEHVETTGSIGKGR